MYRFGANLSFLFTEWPWLDRFARSAEAGFEGVELLFPYAMDPGHLRQALDQTGQTLILFNTPPGDWDGGDRGFAAVPGADARFVADLEVVDPYLRALAPQHLHVLSGLGEGPEAFDTLVNNLRRAVDRFPGQSLLIEPINHRDIPGYFLNTTDQALAVIDAVGSPNVGLQLDVYHLQITQGDVTRHLETLAPHIRHIQVAGVPMRGEPHGGELDFAHVLRTLDRIGYAGWISGEYRPKGATLDGLGWRAL